MFQMRLPWVESGGHDDGGPHADKTERYAAQQPMQREDPAQPKAA